MRPALAAAGGMLAGVALAALARRRGQLEEPSRPAPAGALEVPAAELEQPDELPHAWLAWDLDDRLWRSLVILRIAEQNNDDAWIAKARRGLAGLGYRV